MADLPRGSDLTSASIATHIGYAPEYALAKAFERSHGVSPGRLLARR